MKILMVDDDKEKGCGMEIDIRDSVYSKFEIPYELHRAMAAAIDSVYIPKPRKEKKCLLPECDILTDHQGGYCCAEHCKKHKRIQKGK